MSLESFDATVHKVIETFVELRRESRNQFGSHTDHYLNIKRQKYFEIIFEALEENKKVLQNIYDTETYEEEPNKWKAPHINELLCTLQFLQETVETLDKYMNYYMHNRRYIHSGTKREAQLESIIPTFYNMYHMELINYIRYQAEHIYPDYIFSAVTEFQLSLLGMPKE